MNPASTPAISASRGPAAPSAQGAEKGTGSTASMNVRNEPITYGESQEIMTKSYFPTAETRPSDVTSLVPTSLPARRGDDLAKVSAPIEAEYNLDLSSATFPERLMELLEEKMEPEALWWLGESDCFCIDPKRFPDQVLNKYFQGTKFESFTRKLNRWGYKRSMGHHVPAHTLAYHHPHFKRGSKELMKGMRGTKKRESSPADLVAHKGPSSTSSSLSAVYQNGDALRGRGRSAPPRLVSLEGTMLPDPLQQELHLRSILWAQQDDLARLRRLHLLTAELAVNAQACAELRRQTLASAGMCWISPDLSPLFLAPSQIPSSADIPSILGGVQATGSISHAERALVHRALERQRQGERMTSGF